MNFSAHPHILDNGQVLKFSKIGNYILPELARAAATWILEVPIALFFKYP